MADRRDILISKSLSYLLRHGAVKEHLHIDNNGYVAINELLRHNRLKTHKCNLEDIHRIVRDNDKQRFHLKKNTLESGSTEELVCATQGHSIGSIVPDQEILQPVEGVSELPTKLIHGTNVGSALLIIKSGFIKKLSRNHIHLSPGVTGVDKQVVSGMRHYSNVFIYLKIGHELLDNLKLYKSLNNVYLTSSDIPISLFEKVTIKRKNSDKKAKEIDMLLQELSVHGIAYELSDSSTN